MELPAYRPPSEAYSLLVRATRNCPWNKCAFCAMYRGKQFSLRTVEEVKEDIITARQLWERVKKVSLSLGLEGRVNHLVRSRVIQESGTDIASFPWLYRENLTAFIADSNSLAMPAKDLAEVVRFLRATFPEVIRVTSYARAKTLLRRTPEELKTLRETGLDRLHVGLETGDDQLLALIRKGATASEMAAAGRKAKEAGFEFSMYVILGLGGKQLWQQHAIGTAELLNAVDPHFIRLRTLMIQPGTLLEELQAKGEFHPSTPVEILQEEKLLLERLEVTSHFVSDHISNYLALDGKLPDDKEALLSNLNAVLEQLILYPQAATNLLQPEHLRTL